MRMMQELGTGTPAFEFREARALHEDLITRRKSVEEVNSASSISKIKTLPQKEKESLQDNRTARLIMRKFIKAECSGHWNASLYGSFWSQPLLQNKPA